MDHSGDLVGGNLNPDNDGYLGTICVTPSYGTGDEESTRNTNKK